MYKLFIEKQQKFVYYLLSISSTAIGFSIYSTMDKKIDWYFLPLGIALILWAASIFSGLRFIQYTLANLYVNFELLKSREKLDPYNQAKADALHEVIGGNSEKTTKLQNIQNNLFFTGMIFYVVWYGLLVSHN